MRLFDGALIDELCASCEGSAIGSIGVSTGGFVIEYGAGHQISARVRVDAFIGSKPYFWEYEPTDMPVGLLIEQLPLRFELRSPDVARMVLQSGDWLDIHTHESRYEAVVIRLRQASGDAIIVI